MIGEDIYNGLREQADWIGTLSSATVDAFECLCAGIQNDAQNHSVLGINISQGGLIHVLTANEPEGGIKHGQEFVFTDSTGKTFNIRIAGMKPRFGMNSLTVEAVN